MFVAWLHRLTISRLSHGGDGSCDFVYLWFSFPRRAPTGMQDSVMDASIIKSTIDAPRLETSPVFFL